MLTPQPLAQRNMDSQLTDALARCRQLPSTAGIALRIIALAQDPDADIQGASELIGMDPGLAGRIMRLANSPLYASRRKVETLNQAMTMLGLHATLHLALGLTLIGSNDDEAWPAAAHARLCKRSVLCAIAARLLGESTGMRQTDELMLASLLQDIGALSLLQIEQERYATLVLETRDNETLLELEQNLLGFQHDRIGGELARMWHLPDSLANAIAHSEHIDQAGNTFERCVALSGLLADIWLCDDPSRQRLRAHAACQHWLGLDQETLEGALIRMEALLPTMNTLFNTRILTPPAVRDLLQQAAEVSLLRQLRNQQQATQIQHDAQQLQEQAIKLAEQARLDPLTGVTNRRHMETQLELEFSRATHGHHPLSLAFIDLDDFKKINDRHGHITGDQVLKAFAGQLATQLRETDTVARFGGEEFVVIFPSTDEEMAAVIIRRVLDLISQIPVANADGAPLYVTFSAGIACHGGKEHFDSAEELLRAADDALYRSKHLGRNRVQMRSRILHEVAD